MVPNAAEVLKQLGGTARFNEILRHTTRRHLQRAVARREVHQLARGVFTLPDTRKILQAAAAVHGVVSHQSAAAFWLIRSLTPATSVHVTVPRNARPIPRRGVILHYADLDEEEATSPLRTVLDCARTLPFREALAIADSALNLGLINSDQLRVGAEQLRGHGRPQARRIARHATGAAANPFESALRAILIEAGIKGFVPQLVIPGCVPQIRVDLGNSRRKIVLEADSFSFHASAQALERDCRRYDELVSRGWLVLRFSYHQVLDDPAWVGEMVLSTCGLRNTAARRGAP